MEDVPPTNDPRHRHLDVLVDAMSTAPVKAMENVQPIDDPSRPKVDAPNASDAASETLGVRVEPADEGWSAHRMVGMLRSRDYWPTGRGVGLSFGCDSLDNVIIFKSTAFKKTFDDYEGIRVVDQKSTIIYTSNDFEVLNLFFRKFYPKLSSALDGFNDFPNDIRGEDVRISFVDDKSTARGTPEVVVYVAPQASNDKHCLLCDGCKHPKTKAVGKTRIVIQKDFITLRCEEAHSKKGDRKSGWQSRKIDEPQIVQSFLDVFPNDIRTDTSDGEDYALPSDLTRETLCSTFNPYDFIRMLNWTGEEFRQKNDDQRRIAFHLLNSFDRACALNEPMRHKFQSQLCLIFKDLVGVFQRLIEFHENENSDGELLERLHDTEQSCSRFVRLFDEPKPSKGTGISPNGWAMFHEILNNQNNTQVVQHMRTFFPQNDLDCRRVKQLMRCEEANVVCVRNEDENGDAMYIGRMSDGYVLHDRANQSTMSRLFHNDDDPLRDLANTDGYKRDNDNVLQHRPQYVRTARYVPFCGGEKTTVLDTHAMELVDADEWNAIKDVGLNNLEYDFFTKRNMALGNRIDALLREGKLFRGDDGTMSHTMSPNEVDALVQDILTKIYDIENVRGEQLLLLKTLTDQHFEYNTEQKGTLSTVLMFVASLGGVFRGNAYQRTHENAPMCVGEGNSGKSTVIQAVLEKLCHEKIYNMEQEHDAKSSFGNNGAVGRLATIASEYEPPRIDEGYVGRAIGGEEFGGRGLFKNRQHDEHITIPPPFFQCNNPPLAGMTHELKLLRRWLIFYYLYHIENSDTTFKSERLPAELADNVMLMSFCAMLVEGLRSNPKHHIKMFDLRNRQMRKWTHDFFGPAHAIFRSIVNGKNELYVSRNPRFFVDVNVLGRKVFDHLDDTSALRKKVVRCVPRQNEHDTYDYKLNDKYMRSLKRCFGITITEEGRCFGIVDRSILDDDMLVACGFCDEFEQVPNNMNEDKRKSINDKNFKIKMVGRNKWCEAVSAYDWDERISVPLVEQERQRYIMSRAPTLAAPFTTVRGKKRSTLLNDLDYANLDDIGGFFARLNLSEMADLNNVVAGITPSVDSTNDPFASKHDWLYDLLKSAKKNDLSQSYPLLHEHFVRPYEEANEAAKGVANNQKRSASIGEEGDAKRPRV